MEIKIVIDDVAFDEVIKNELNAIPKEDIQQIIKDAIAKRLTSPTYDENGKQTNKNVLDSYFFDTNTSYYGGYSAAKPSQLLTDILKNVDYSDVTDTMKETVIDYIKKNAKTVVGELMANFLIQGMSSSLFSNFEFTERIRNVFREVHYEMHPENQQ